MAGCRRLTPMAARARAGAPNRTVALLVALSVAGLGAAACTAAPAHRSTPAGPLAARTRRPTTATTWVLAGRASADAAEIARRLFVSSPVVIVAQAGSRSALATAAIDAVRAHAPVLLASRPSGKPAKVLSSLTRAEIKALRPHAVLAVGVSGPALSAALGGIRVVTDPAKLRATKAPAPLTKVVLLAPRGDSSAQASAATATARVAGASVVLVRGFDPRADPAAIRAVSAVKPDEVLALGARFGPARRLAARVAVAATGKQLPGGGEVLFPMHRLVALYGHPGTPGLGALGEQDLAASIARVKRLAARYRSLSRVPVVPAFEIIASVAQGADEPEGGTYSYLTPVAEIRPWVTQATKAGLYVILDLQAGRASLLAQAKVYRQLLDRPDVGLAIDPEWKLGPGQLPLRQIGAVTSKQVNSVANWLAALTARHHLPQKLLVLHQFRLSMIGGEYRIDTRHDDLAIVIHMDGQGTPGNKQQTWDAVTGAAPPHVYFGWKNFFVKDHPMLTPAQTMARSPKPIMISYQ
jgi:hypothetical protein